MKTVLWKKDATSFGSLCDIRLKCFDIPVQAIIENYLTTIYLYNEKQTGIGSPSWTEEDSLYVLPIEFAALEQMADVFGIEFVEEV